MDQCTYAERADATGAEQQHRQSIVRQMRKER